MLLQLHDIEGSGQTPSEVRLGGMCLTHGHSSITGMAALSQTSSRGLHGAAYGRWLLENGSAFSYLPISRNINSLMGLGSNSGQAHGHRQRSTTSSLRCSLLFFSVINSSLLVKSKGKAVVQRDSVISRVNPKLSVPGLSHCSHSSK